ncbi:MAG: hypothetical protein AB7D35_04995 [Bacteroidales bacterium]
MKIINNLTVMAFVAIAFLFAQTTVAAEVTVYGKGGVSGGHGSGGTTVKICPEASTAKCATLTIDINEIKINGVDGNIIVINKDDISVLMIPNISSDIHSIQGESIEIKLFE